MKFKGNIREKMLKNPGKILRKLLTKILEEVEYISFGG